VSQCCLPQAGRTKEKKVIERLFALTRCLDKNFQILFQFGLSNELIKRSRPESEIEIEIFGLELLRDQAVGFPHGKF